MLLTTAGCGPNYRKYWTTGAPSARATYSGPASSSPLAPAHPLQLPGPPAAVAGQQHELARVGLAPPHQLSRRLDAAGKHALRLSSV